MVTVQAPAQRYCSRRATGSLQFSCKRELVDTGLLRAILRFPLRKKPVKSRSLCYADHAPA